ncbi:serine/threonine-protein kinase [Atopobiaceae bacterium 24-176]
METQTSPALLLGRYRTIELRDTGGFGSVLVCWDVRLQRRVAVKCLPLDAEEGAESVVDEALAEARASSFLTHPNIVTVHDFAVDESYAYIVMEYVDGVTLAELMARVEGGVLIWCEVAHVLKSVAAALAYAHDNGVLHLDIKPANVMIARDGSVKLADFGMASIASAAGWGGARGGTVGYMPPEQLTGDLVDERTDVFALAAVCYEALTGQRPFAASTPAASLKLIDKGAPPLSDAEQGLAGPATLAFQTALAPSPSGRMTDPEEFAGEVLPSLGDPEEGRDSIVSLLDEEEGGEEPFDEDAWRALDPPGRRIPWLAGAAARLASASCAAALAWQCAAPLAALGPAAVVGLIVGAAALGAALPAVACAAGFVLTGCAFAATAAAAGLPAQAVLGCAAAVLLALVPLRLANRSQALAPAVLAAPALGAWTIAPALAAFALPPAAAAATSAAAAVLTQAVTGQGALWSADPAAAAQAVAALPQALATPAPWVAASFSAAAAAAASAMGRGRGAGVAAAGQVIGLVVTLMGCGVAGGLEFGGIWSAQSGAPMGLALGSTVLMIIAITLFGPPELRREGEDRELS